MDEIQGVSPIQHFLMTSPRRNGKTAFLNQMKALHERERLVNSYTFNWQTMQAVYDEAVRRNTVGTTTTGFTETIDGYVGQVRVDGVIVWQGKPRKKHEKAKADADRKVAEAHAAIYAEDVE